MKILRLYAATLLAIKEHAELGEPFSARDITEYIRGKLADNEWELDSGLITVNHDTIRGNVHEIMDNGLLTLSLGNYTFRKTYPRNLDGDSYKQYSVVFGGNVEKDGDIFDKLDQPPTTSTVGTEFSYSHSPSQTVNVVVENGKVSISIE